MLIAFIVILLTLPIYGQSDSEEKIAKSLVKATISACTVAPENTEDLFQAKISVAFTIENQSDAMLFICDPNRHDIVITNIVAKANSRKIDFYYGVGFEVEYIELRNFKLLDRNRYPARAGVSPRSAFSDGNFVVEFNPSEVVNLMLAEFVDNQERIPDLRKLPKVQEFSVEGYVRLIIVDPKNDKRVASKLPFNLTWQVAK